MAAKAKTAKLAHIKLSPRAKNLAANYINFAAVAAINFFVSPHLLNLLGPAQFGIWKASLRYLEFAATADGRSTQALKWMIAFHSNGNDADVKRRLVGASIAITGALLPVLASVAAVIVFFSSFTMADLSQQDTEMMRFTCAILAVNVLLTAIATVPDAVLTGSNQGYRSISLSTGIIGLNNIGFLVAASNGLGPPTLALISVAGTLTNGMIAWLIVRKTIPWWGISRPTRTDVRAVWKFTGWTMVWSFVQLLMISAEFILIGYLVGPEGVTAYAFTSFPVQLGLSACLLTISASTPSLGALFGSGDFAQTSAMVKSLREITIALATISGAGILALNEDFVGVWAGDSSFLGQTANIAMVASFVQLALIRCESQLQDVSLDIRKKAIYGAAGSALSIALGLVCYNLVPHMGSIFAGVIAGRLGVSIIYPALASKTLRAGTYPLARLAAAGAILLLAGVAGLYIEVETWPRMIAATVVVGLILLPLTMFLVLSRETRAAILQRPLRAL